MKKTIEKILYEKMNADQKAFFGEPHPMMEFTVKKFKKNDQDNDYTFRSKPVFDPSYAPRLDEIDRIGISGWRVNSSIDKSDGAVLFIPYDIDAIGKNHKNTNTTMTNEELKKVIEVIIRRKIGWLFHSTGGEGYHLWVKLKHPVKVTSRKQAKKLANWVLNEIFKGVQGGELLLDKKDHTGDNTWVYGKNAPENAFKCIFKGEDFEVNADSWEVEKRIDEIYETNPSLSQKTKVFLEELKNQNGYVKFDKTDKNEDLVSTHTVILKNVCDKLGCEFETASPGTELNTPNCFFFPSENQIRVYRYGVGTGEAPTWRTSTNGYTYFVIKFNQYKMLDPMRLSKGLYHYSNFDELVKDCLKLGVEIPTIERFKQNHSFKVQVFPNKITVFANKISGEIELEQDWVRNNKRELSKTFALSKEIEENNYIATVDLVDECLRYVIDGDKAHYYNKTDTGFIPIADGRINDYLEGKPIPFGVNAKAIAIEHPYHIVTAHFQNEVVYNYTLPNGTIIKRALNNGSQFRYPPQKAVATVDDFPTIAKIYNHLFSGIDDQIKNDPMFREMGVTSGFELGIRWIAAKVQNPNQALPALCFYSKEQDNGKTSLGLFFNKCLFKTGVVDVKTYFETGFSDCLRGCFIATLDDIGLRKEHLDKAKVLVTDEVQVHPKHGVPYTLNNSIAFIHTANDLSYFSIPDGDTRNIVIKVPKLTNKIAKNVLIEECRKEAPAFLRYILDINLPKSNERTYFPVLNTESKTEIMNRDSGGFEEWFMECVFRVDGESIGAKELYAHYCNSAISNSFSPVIKREFFLKMTEKGIICGTDSDKIKTYGNITLNSSATKAHNSFIVNDGKLRRK